MTASRGQGSSAAGRETARLRCTTGSRGQDGFTLIEALVSIALISTVILALSAGLLTSVKSSIASKETQQTDEALSSYAESLKAATLASYPTAVACPAPSTFGAPTPPGAAAAAVTAVEYWDPGVEGFVACSPSPPPSADTNIHRLTVSVTVDGLDGVGQVVVRRS